MHNVLVFMMRIEALKRTARAGWNKEFPDAHTYKTRRVPGAESVADHSWSLAMFALLMADRLGLDPLVTVQMALLHDLAESLTEDIVTDTLGPDEKARVKAEKRRLEDAAMREILLPLGEWGGRMYAMWRAFEDGATPEAQVLHQLDKLEACIQAVCYEEQGHQVIAAEFFFTTEPILEHPELIALFDALCERAQGTGTTRPGG